MTKTEPKLDAENLTPAQKAAITRAKKKAVADEEAAKLAVAAGDAKVVDNDPFASSEPIPVNQTVEEIIEVIDAAADSEFVQVTVSKVTPKIGAAARNVIYNIGFYAGIVGTIAPLVAAYFTGDVQIAIASVGAAGLALTNLLAKLNLSKTSDDLAKETAKG